MKTALLLFFTLLLGCALPAARPTVEIYKIGDITFRLYETRESLTKEVFPKLPPMQQALLGLPGQALGGYHDPKTRTIYTIKNVYNLLHELKHEMEPEWKHDLICGEGHCLESFIMRRPTQ